MLKELDEHVIECPPGITDIEIPLQKFQ